MVAQIEFRGIFVSAKLSNPLQRTNFHFVIPAGDKFAVLCYLSLEVLWGCAPLPVHIRSLLLYLRWWYSPSSCWVIFGRFSLICSFRSVILLFPCISLSFVDNPTSFLPNLLSQCSLAQTRAPVFINWSIILVTTNNWMRAFCMTYERTHHPISSKKSPFMIWWNFTSESAIDTRTRALRLCLRCSMKFKTNGTNWERSCSVTNSTTLKHFLNFRVSSSSKSLGSGTRRVVLLVIYHRSFHCLIAATFPSLKVAVDHSAWGHYCSANVIKRQGGTSYIASPNKTTAHPVSLLFSFFYITVHIRKRKDELCKTTFTLHKVTPLPIFASFLWRFFKLFLCFEILASRIWGQSPLKN